MKQISRNTKHWRERLSICSISAQESSDGHDFLSNNIKPLWHYIKAQRQEHTGISTLKDSTSGHTITDPAEKANALNEHFKSVFTVEDNETIPNKGISLYTSLPDFEITTQGVCNILSNSNPYKSPGPGCIHSYALKVTTTEVSPMLTHVFQQSLDSGVVPTQWKHSYVSLMFKKGSKTDPKNYLPISVTSVVCKSMEHIIVSQIMKHLDKYNILTQSVRI